jgi:hypothetical protein
VKLAAHLHLVEVKEWWLYTSTPPHIFVAWCLIKQRDNFTLTFNLSGTKTTAKIRIVLQPAESCYMLVQSRKYSGHILPAADTFSESIYINPY